MQWRLRGACLVMLIGSVGTPGCRSIGPEARSPDARSAPDATQDATAAGDAATADAPSGPDATAGGCPPHVPAPPQPAPGFKVLRLAQGKAYYFSTRIKSSALVFKGDGRYESFAFGAADAGTWKQLADGRLRLLSEKRFQPIATSAMYVHVIDDEGFGRAKRLREVLRSHLDKTPAKTFSRAEVMDRMRHRDRRGLERSTIGLYPGVETISRQDLEELVSEIDGYLESEERNAFYATPYAYRDVVMLVREESRVDPNFERIRNRVDQGDSLLVEMIEVDQAYHQAAAKKARQSRSKVSSGTTAKAAPQIKGHRLEEGVSHYFRKTLAHSRYLALVKDGTYRDTSTGHFGVGERDHGRWTQTQDGTVRLTSKARLRDINAGPLMVRVRSQEDLSTVPCLIEALEGFIESNDTDIFDRATIRGILRHASGSGPARSVIDLYAPATRASKRNLSRLLAAARAYLDDPQKGVFDATPYTDGSAVYLIFADSGQTPEGLTEQLGKGRRPMVHTSIDEATYRKASARPQPFRHFPGMSKGVGKMRQKSR